MVDPMQWLRDQIAAERRRGLTIEHSPDNRWSNPDAVPMAAREIYARCDSHTALLDHFLEPDDKGDQDEQGVHLLALAYRHNSGYDQFAALAAPEVKMQLSDIARADELAARRNREGKTP